MAKSAKPTYSVFFDQIFRLIFVVVMGFLYVGDALITFVAYAVNGFILLKRTISHAIFMGAVRTVDMLKMIKRPFSKVWTMLAGQPKKKSVKAVAVRKTPSSQKRPQKSRFSTFKSHLLYFLLGLATALSILVAERGYTFVNELPNPKLIGNVNFQVSTQIYDRNGKLLYDVFHDQDRIPVDIDQLPEYVIQATVAIEDRNFYNHKGISPIGGILRASKEFVAKGNVQGGSTITQQLVKSSLLSPERTLMRKVREAILAIWTERMYTKNQIMQMYLNQVPYGGSAYGIEKASKTYFNKSAKDLTLNEAALLAGLTRAPSRYSPFVDPALARDRRNDVLKAMQEVGYITQEQLTKEIAAEIVVQPPKTFIRAPHFVFYVKSLLEQKYGIRQVEEGGLRVTTTLDIDLQVEAEKILNEELTKIQHLNVSNGSVLVTAPGTGEILSMVGSRNYFESPYGAYNVTTALRQPGSSIKPLMYSLALEKNYTAASIIQDSPVTYAIPGSRPYSPVNYDGKYHGAVSLRYALANSYNIPAVKIMNDLGVRNFITHAQRLGLTTLTNPDRYGLSLALGAAEVKMTDMATAYGVFANYGEKVQLNPILKIENYKGDVLYSFQPESDGQVLSQETSFIIADILSDNYARQFAFGLNSDLNLTQQKVAVKTGTTNSKRDNWAIGFTPKYLTAVWVGNNNNAPMNQQLTSGVTGASPIWKRVMTLVLERNQDINMVNQPETFTVPSGVVTLPCYFGRVEYFRVGTAPAGCKGSLFNVPSGPTTLTPYPSLRLSPTRILFQQQDQQQNNGTTNRGQGQGQGQGQEQSQGQIR